MSEDNYYVYELAYPESMGHSVFYVGKGSGYRINDHEREALNGVQSYKCNVIRKIWAEGGQVVKRKVHEHLTEQAAYTMECLLIAQYERENLTNMTDGGESGGPGRPRKYTNRVRTSIELSQEVLDAIDQARGTDSRAIEVERALRKVYGLSAKQAGN